MWKVLQPKLTLILHPDGKLHVRQLGIQWPWNKNKARKRLQKAQMIYALQCRVNEEALQTLQKITGKKI